jgi:ornithine carbamoyltransferase
MKHTLRLTDYSKEEIKEIFHIADELQEGKYKGFLADKTIVMFFRVQASGPELHSNEEFIYLADKPSYFHRKLLIKKKKQRMLLNI